MTDRYPNLIGGKPGGLGTRETRAREYDKPSRPSKLEHRKKGTSGGRDNIAIVWPRGPEGKRERLTTLICLWPRRPEGKRERLTTLIVSRTRVRARNSLAPPKGRPERPGRKGRAGRARLQRYAVRAILLLFPDSKLKTRGFSYFLCL